LKLSAYLFVLVLGLADATGVSAQSSGTQSQSPPGQQPAQPTQPDQPAKSAGDKSQQDKNNQDKSNQDKSNQDQLPTPPIVAGTSNDVPLTGASQPIIGLVASRSYIIPSVFFFGQLDSNAGNTVGNYHFASINTLMGSLAVQKLGRASQFNLGYLAGRSFSSQNDAFNSTTQEVAASELWSRGRWDGFILDKLLYSSEAAFLGGSTPFDIAGLNSVAGLAGTPVVLRNTFLPGQGIFTPFGPRVSNALVAQINNHLSRRTFFTLVGNYDILHFYNSSLATTLPSNVQATGFKLIDSSAAGFQTGIGYQRSRRDTFAVVYRFNDLWFSGVPVSVRDNTLQGAYQRQVGERLLFQLGAGPEISFIHNPNLAGTTLASDTRVSWTVNTLLHYQMSRGFGVSAGYDHFLSSGSGVFLGAITDQVFVGLNRQLSRVWTLDVSASYSHNRNLVPLFNVGTLVAPTNATYDSVYGGVELHRRFGRDSDVFFGYLGRYQTSSFVLCPQGICQGSNLVGHQFNFGFAWHLKPVPIG
jgi:hypothetical protein